MGIASKRIIKIADYLKNSSLRIPQYQRPYKWTVRNVVQLIQDVEKFSGEIPYRIGTVVLYIDKDKVKMEIVDGQQRTITFLLIINALNEYLENYSEFHSQIKEITNSSFQPEFSNDISKQNIYTNYQEIKRRIKTWDNTIVDFFLNRCEVTLFVIDDLSEAFQFFDAQNARGKDLKPHDLLKAFHLRELEKDIKKLSAGEKEEIVDTWEEMNEEKLAHLFSDFLYRVRCWSRGDNAKHFSKKDIRLFKGITLQQNDDLPYINIYKHTLHYVEGKPNENFPFQLDQVIINGRIFFEMITYYKKFYDEFVNEKIEEPSTAKEILKTISNYEGATRIGDGYVKMLFDSALLFYIDKFGKQEIEKAIEKIFIWSYTVRLSYQVLQIASLDNYVVDGINLFKKIKEATYREEIINIELPMLNELKDSNKSFKIQELFKEMNYYGNG
jgi:hypothetical protein